MFQYLSVILDSILILEYMSMDEQLKTAYKQAIQDPCANLDKLSRLTPVLGEDGEPYCIDGSKSVVFKMLDPESGKYYALKCFAEIPDSSEKLRYKLIADELVMVDSPYFVHMRFIEDEIQAEISYPEDRLPVLLMDWVDGETLAEYLADNYQYTFSMSILCYRFCKMAAWLHIQDFAHGDITPSHIMVRPDGTLTLIGYDGMFIPSMKGSLSSALLSSEFCHPKRKIDEFDEHIDDFSLISIALSLKAISLDPSLFDSYGSPERLLFTKEDYCKPEQSKVIASLQQLMYDKEFCSLYSFFMLALVNGNLSLGSLKLFACENPRKLQVDVPEPEQKHRSTSRHKVRYSDDGRKFFGGNYIRCRHYVLNEGVRIICDKAFYGWDNLESIEIPSSVEVIGDFVFYGCNNLKEIHCQSGVAPIATEDTYGNQFKSAVIYVPTGAISNYKTTSGWCMFSNYKEDPKLSYIRKSDMKSDNVSLSNDTLYCNLTSDEVGNLRDYVLGSASDLSSIKHAVLSGYLGDGDFSFLAALASAYQLSSLDMTNLQSTYTYRFQGCSQLKEVKYSRYWNSTGFYLFELCANITKVDFPSNIIGEGYLTFDNGTFRDCISLEDIRIPSTVQSFGSQCFFLPLHPGIKLGYLVNGC